MCFEFISHLSIFLFFYRLIIHILKVTRILIKKKQTWDVFLFLLLSLPLPFTQATKSQPRENEPFAVIRLHAPVK